MLTHLPSPGPSAEVPGSPRSTNEMNQCVVQFPEFFISGSLVSGLTQWGGKVQSCLTALMQLSGHRQGFRQAARGRNYLLSVQEMGLTK